MIEVSVEQKYFTSDDYSSLSSGSGIKAFLYFQKHEKIVFAQMNSSVNILNLKDDKVKQISTGSGYLLLDLVKLSENEFLSCGFNGKITWYNIENEVTECGVFYTDETGGIIPLLLRISDDMILIPLVHSKHEMVKIIRSNDKSRIGKCVDRHQNTDFHFRPPMSMYRSKCHKNGIYFAGIRPIDKIYSTSLSSIVFLYDHEKKSVEGVFDCEECKVSPASGMRTLVLMKRNERELLFACAGENFIFMFDTSVKTRKCIRKIDIKTKACCSLLVDERYLFVGSSIRDSYTRDTCHFRIFDVSEEEFPEKPIHGVKLPFSKASVIRMKLMDVKPEKSEVLLFGSSKSKLEFFRFKVKGLQFRDSLALGDLKERISFLFDVIDEMKQEKVEVFKICVSGMEEICIFKTVLYIYKQ